MKNRSDLYSVFSLACVAVVAWFAILGQEPRTPSGAEVAPQDFSAARAAVDIAAIAERPHPIASADHERVRRYILERMRALGVEPELQETTAIFARDKLAGRVTNILARLQGTANTKAVMLAAHYDSVPSGPGAGDDSSGVAVLLETIRALRAGPPVANDVIFLITDGEEVGLLGAAAFTAEHPWAKEVGLVLNFEARGNAGPAMMFESTPGNERLIDLLRENAPEPQASSLTYAVYQHMPNDTDLTVFRGSGLAGLNFAFIGNIEAYHTRLDTPGNLSAGTLQQQGSYAVSIARAAGNTDLRVTSSVDRIYFNTYGPHLVAYPERWAKPLAIAALLLLLIVSLVGLRRREFTGGNLALATLALPLALGATASLALVMLGGARWLHRVVLPPGSVITSGWYAGSVVALAFAVAATLSYIAHRRLPAASLAVATLVWWAILSMATSVLLPGASYLFVWPTIFVTLSVAVVVTAKPDAQIPLRRELAALALLLLAVLVLAPVGYSLRVAFPLNSLGTIILAAYTSIALCLIGVPLHRSITTFGWRVPAIAFACVFALFVAGAAFTRYTATHPQASNLLYLLDTDSGRAFWAGREATRNAWTDQILTSAPERKPLPAFVSADAGDFLHHEAPVAALSPPVVTVVSDSMTNGRRALGLKVSAGPDVWEIRVRLSGAEVSSAQVNGKPMMTDASESRAPGAEWDLRFFNPGSDGIELALELEPLQPFVVRTTAYHLGLPSLANGSPPTRPDTVMPNHEGDLTMIAHAVQFDAAPHTE